MSKTVKAYRIDPFVTDTAEKRPEFVSIFGDSPRTDKSEEQPSAEEQARKIFEDAFAQGEKAGHEVGMKKVEQVLKRLNSYLGELDALRSHLLKQAEEMSVKLSLIFAEALVLKECSEKREIIVNMAKRALEICEDKCDIVIRVRREDAELLTRNALGHLKVVPDDTLKEPGFIVETGFGDIDGRISTQLAELKKEFLDDQSS